MDDGQERKVYEALWPGMFGLAVPNMHALEIGGMADQARGGFALARPPDRETLEEWSAGTLGLTPVGGRGHLGGWFITRSVAVQWKPKLRCRTKKDRQKARDSLHYYRAGDSGHWDFFANRCAFQPARLRALMANQVKAMVRVVMPHVRSADGAYAWISNVVHKEVQHTDAAFLSLCSQHNIGLEDVLLKLVQANITRTFACQWRMVAGPIIGRAGRRGTESADPAQAKIAEPKEEEEEEEEEEEDGDNGESEQPESPPADCSEPRSTPHASESCGLCSSLAWPSSCLRPGAC